MVVIFDIEASCADRKLNPNYNMETIEIGAVKVDRNKIIDTFQTFIKPEYIDDLTPYCTKLTGITFKDLENAPSFNQAIIEFHHFIKDYVIYSCGNFDKKFLINELLEKGTTYEHLLAKNAIKSSHKDLKRLFSQITNEQKSGMIKMAQILDIELKGVHHRALDDAVNLANIYIELENIREKRLLKTFSKKFNRIVKSLNDNHNYELNVIDENDIISTEGRYTFLEFIDNWADIMITDTLERKLNYISMQEVSILRRFAKLWYYFNVSTKYKNILV